MPTTCASRALKDFVAPYDATVVQRLRQNGSVIIGKTNMDEFAMGTYNTTSSFGPAINPWSYLSPQVLSWRAFELLLAVAAVFLTPVIKQKTLHVSGGSSGGSAAAVAAYLCHGSLGSDTGGSIRLPASYCGVVGWKPSYGRLSRHGLVAYASSLDTPGVFAHTVRDAAHIANAASGHDVNDMTSVNLPPMSFLPTRGSSLRGLTVGLPKEFYISELPTEVLDLWRKCSQQLTEAGATVVQTSLPTTKAGLSCYYVIAMAEASSNLARYDGLKYGHRSGKAESYESLSDFFSDTRTSSFGPEVARRIVGGNFLLSRMFESRLRSSRLGMWPIRIIYRLLVVPSISCMQSDRAFDSYYLQALRVRQKVVEDFDRVFEHEGIDVLLVPTAPGPSPSLEDTKAEARLLSYAKDVFTVTPSLAGLPAISVPTGLSHSLLPLGMQVIGPRLGEEKVLRVAQALEDTAQFPEHLLREYLERV
eukprot:m.370913 g.370913  ORF g.370913 m.370913 type:complete len:476 (-) comp56138_c0_seq12:1410-2837(-)